MKNDKEVEVIIMEGEHTGHAHRAAGVGLALKEREFHVPELATISHEEHKAKVLPAGDWEIRRVVELDPAGDRREVID